SEEKMGEKIVDWMDCDIDSGSVQQVMVLEDGRIAGLMREYNEAEERDVCSLVLLSRVDPSTLPVKTPLTLACMWLDWDLRTQIIAFNRTSDKYRILINEYSQYATADDYNAGLTKLNTEIISGKIPDMLYTADLPIAQYAGQGLLEDLMPYLEADAELSADDLMQNVLEAVKTDGKLYQTFAEFSIETAAALEKVVGEYDTWTLDEVRDAMSKLEPDATIFDVGYTQSSVLTSCVQRNLGSFIDWQTGTCSFDSDEFKTYLEFAKEFPKEFSWEEYDWEDYVDSYTALRSGKQLLIPAYLGNLENYLWMLASVQDEIRFVGYPTQSGQGSCFTGVSGISITSSCKDKDGAWSFARKFFTEDYQQSREWYGLPSNANVFNQRVNEAMTVEYELDADGNPVLDENGEQVVIPKVSYWSESSDEPYTIDAMTQEHLDLFMELYNSVHSVYSSNEAVFEIINEESQYFFEGQRSVDDVASMIQNRVSLFVAEQR
ncbi:MAG: extracellular solute-binding protein, partial [Oscillospiraceae bacterium]|nr:extracellular solute-binding protein [Oscillospiraceae bacterium]